MRSMEKAKKLWYVPPFSAVKNSFAFQTIGGEVTGSITYENLVQLLQRLILNTPVDESWYRNEYPDVAQAIKKGVVRNAKQHFVESGYFEGRFPSEPQVDENWYLSENKDVADAVRAGKMESATHHFIAAGYLEGRLPSAP
jgi:hypothetical protein